MTSVRVNSVRLFCSCRRAAISSCSSLMRSIGPPCRPARRRILPSTPQLLHVARLQPGRRTCQQAEHRARLGASVRCNRTSTRRVAARSTRAGPHARPGSGPRSRPHPGWPCARSRSSGRPDPASGAPAARPERKRSPRRTCSRSRSSERNGLWRSVTSSLRLAQTHSVATWAGVRSKSKITSLNTATSARSCCSMRVEWAASPSMAMKASGSSRCARSQRNRPGTGSCAARGNRPLPIRSRCPPAAVPASADQVRRRRPA